jgi:hypothetical protein
LFNVRTSYLTEKLTGSQGRQEVSHFFETGSHYVAQADFELLGSASVSHIAETTGLNPCAWLLFLYLPSSLNFLDWGLGKKGQEN